MSARHLTPRTIRKALGVVDQLPIEALATLVEALLAKLDAEQVDPDLEPEFDACDAGDDDPAGDYLDTGTLNRSGVNIGDADDAEMDDPDSCGAADDDPRAFLGHHGPGDADDAERDDEDRCLADELPERRTGAVRLPAITRQGATVSVRTLFREGRR